MVDAWDATVARNRSAPAIRYFDRLSTVAEVDADADAFAYWLQHKGIGRGDVVAVYMQSVPQFVVTVLGVWKAGATVLAVNPMYRSHELETVLTDSGAVALVCLEALHADVAAQVVPATAVRHVVTTSELDGQGGDDPRVFGTSRRLRLPGTDDLREVVAAHTGERASAPRPGPDDAALLTYTSGTTGPPKAAVSTHAALAFNAATFRDWAGLDPATDRILGLAPLFHITGMVAHLATAILTGVPLILTHRFHPELVVDQIREHRPTFTIGPITAFIALQGVPGATRDDLRCLTKVMSGGAPVPAAVVSSFEERFGVYIHNAYGLTEASSATHVVPFGTRAPVDPASGATSIGRPVRETTARAVDAAGATLAPGEIGELAIRGPQVFAGYRGRPDETAHALRGDELFTGDAAYVDADGWWFLIDRFKDQINVSGYKVWPREVEDVLYSHPAVHEVAVVGVPDDYRGQAVAAFVSLEPGQDVTVAELQSYTRDRLAAYKCPRHVDLVDELPRTSSGKILRRALRG
jgi:long-chain acyl-CoA synthetase